MSFLAWVFALGGLAIAFPILFHLIRPTPRGSQVFGSLMFLRESPPRISKRNRIDNWLLLLMRAAVIVLLAMAFMRPFFRTGGEIFVNDLPGNRVAILVDKSASMDRGDLWGQVQAELEDVLDKLQPGDDVALFAFDRQIQTLASFADNQVVDLESRKTLIRNQFAVLETTWFGTDLGNALAATADFVSEMDENSRSETGLQIVLISDMQSGAELAGLQSCIWPEDVRVDVRTVSLNDAASNATVRVLSDKTSRALDPGRRVRVTNSAESDVESFSVAWQDSTGNTDEDSRTRFYVPPGTSQILRVPVSEALTPDRLVVTGDQNEFDNRFFVTNSSRQQISIAFFGNDTEDDAKGNLYFLRRVIPESRLRVVNVDRYSPENPTGWNHGLVPRLVVVSGEVSEEVATLLEQYVDQGGLLLAVVTDRLSLDSLSSLLNTASAADVAPSRDGYVMFAGIDFSHPLFQPLSSPRFNDFTNIRYWKHLPVSVDEQAEGSHVIARFDNDLAAIWQNRLGEGIVIGMSSSWRPDDSQLALSTKFVPLITSLLGMAERTEVLADSYVVGQAIALPDSEQPWQVTRPGGQVVEVDRQRGTADLLDQPGVFEFANDEQQFQIAVNLDPVESQTSAMDPSRLESFDVRVGTQPSREELAGSLQKLQDTQLENRQRLWKWLLLGAICLLVLETLVAGKRQTQPVLSEATT